MIELKNTCTQRAPLFEDPVHFAPADPMIIYNKNLDEYWMFYTSRRGDIECENCEWYFGSQIGVAVSSDGCISFSYKGELSLNFEEGLNTFWAPEIITDGEIYHMFVTYSKGVSKKWRDDYTTAHYTSRDLWNWNFVSLLDMEPGVIDISVIRLNEDKWRIWYKRCNSGRCGTHYADSSDFMSFEEKGFAINDYANEGPNVFFWKGRYRMIVDSWDGLSVYSSSDAETWEREGHILDGEGSRSGDANNGHHADIFLSGERAFIVYFTYNLDPYTNKMQDSDIPFAKRRSFIQLAELEISDGKLICNRDKEIGSIKE